MQLTNLCEKTKDDYVLVYCLGRICYDLKSGIEILKKISPGSEALYVCNQLYVYINEAIKLFKEYSPQLMELVKQNERAYDDFSSLQEECDWGNSNTCMNKYVKRYRDDNIHYKPKDTEAIYKTMYEMREDFPELQMEYDKESRFDNKYDLEEKSNMIFVNALVINKGITEKIYAENMFQLAEKCYKVAHTAAEGIISKLG